MSVSSLLHAMAVVPGADETILGAAPGSAFPGNFLGTQMTSVHTLLGHVPQSLWLGLLNRSVPVSRLLSLSHPSDFHELPEGRQPGFRTKIPFHPVSLA